MTTAPRAWILTTLGALRPIDLTDPDVHAAIRRQLDTDLIGVEVLAPGLDAWRDLRACIDGQDVNLSLAWIADRLTDREVNHLPRVCGDVILTSHEGQDSSVPVAVSPEGLKKLRSAFDNEICRQPAA